MLKAEQVSVRYGEQTVVDGLSFSLGEGQWLMLAGPNGAGKSTLIRAITQGVPYTGRIELMGRDVRACRPAQLAQQIGVLAQQHSVSYAYTVEEIVRLGRYAHARGFLSGRDPEGDALVEQRAFLAQVFAQNPRVLLLDEPANHLDLGYQKHIFSLIGRWLSQPGRAVLSVVHDLSLARRYGTHAVLMDGGRCVARGTMEETMTPENLARVYGMDVGGWMRELLGQWA